MYQMPITTITASRAPVTIGELTEIFHGKASERRVRSESAAVAEMFLAADLSRNVFSRITDKNDETRTLYAHEISVARRVINNFGALLQNDEDRIATIVGVALLHDLLELKPHGSQVWTAERLKRKGFSPAFARKVEVMRHVKPTPYLDYVRDLVIADIDCALVKYADLEDNMSPERGARTNPSRQLLEKHAVLYPASLAYIRAALHKEIDPRKISVPEYIMTNPFVDPAVKEADILAENSSDKRRYQSRVANAGQHFARNVGGLFAPRRLAIA